MATSQQLLHLVQPGLHLSDQAQAQRQLRAILKLFLECLDFDGDGGKTLVRHEPSTGNGLNAGRYYDSTASCVFHT